MAEQQTRIAHVGEDLGEGEPGWASGTFSVHWEDRSGDWYRGPEGTDVDEAIEWGRQHADVVLVRVMGEGVLYSAGVRDPQDADTEPWPEKGLLIRPRPIGTPLDGTVREQTWDVESARARYSFVARDLTAAVMESEELLAGVLHEINPRYGKLDHVLAPQRTEMVVSLPSHSGDFAAWAHA